MGSSPSSSLKRKAIATPDTSTTASPTMASQPKKGPTSRSGNHSELEAETPMRATRATRSIHGVARVVTPSSDSTSTGLPTVATSRPPARRALLQKKRKTVVASDAVAHFVSETEPAAKRKLFLGTPTKSNVRSAYTLVRRISGSVGGNGSFGAIYGELTMGSMQKMIELMKEYTGFDSSSRFIDVGSGLGKPSIHVTQDPGVEFSYGIEMERSRWMLGMSNLKAIVDAAEEQETDRRLLKDDEKLGYRCFFDHGNVKSATTFDPFTHVYMFSIGFPPGLWVDLSEMFNRSAAGYLICFHSPKVIVEDYGFQVHLLTQTPTSMHGSSEGHMGYIYKRHCSPPPRHVGARGVSCDPLFQDAYDITQGSLSGLRKRIDATMEEHRNEGRLTRSRGVQMCIEPEE